MTAQINILKLPEVQKMCGISRSLIYSKLSDPAENFPRPIKLGARSIGFVESEIQTWLSKKIESQRT